MGQQLEPENNLYPDSNPPMPIIVGVMRSGTTLLRLMLDSHSQIAVTHEAGFIPSVANLTNPLSRMFYRRIARIASEGRWKDSLREEFFRVVTEFGNWNDFHLSKSAFKEELNSIEPFTVSRGIRVFFQAYAKRLNKPRWGEKTPFYVLHLRRIESVLPEAHFIHIIRDGRDVAVSVKGLAFGGGEVEAIARLWLRQVDAGRKQSQKCSKYIEVRYEDLLVNTETVLRQICAFINVAFESSMEQYHVNARERMSELTPRYKHLVVTKEDRLRIHKLTSQPPQPTRIGRWRTELTKDELNCFTRIAGDLLEELGYGN